MQPPSASARSWTTGGEALRAGPPHRGAIPAEPGPNTVASIDQVAVARGAEQTRALLYEVPPVYHTQINDVLLTALLQSAKAGTREWTVLLDLEGHGLY